MANFKYRGRDPQGGNVEGVLEAATVDAVATQLMNSGVTPVDIAEVAKGGDDVFADLRKLLTAEKPDLEDLILFARRMYTLMRAGVPINQATDGLARSTRNQILVEVLGEIQIDLESGRDFSTALGVIRKSSLHCS